MYGSFNAQEFQPSNGGGGSHPVGIFVGNISEVEIKPTKSGSGGMFVVTLKSAKGEIVQRYNLWNENPQAVEIARGQLSALCHAIQYYNLNFDADGGRAIIGAPLMFEVGPQNVPSDPNDAKSAKVPSPTLNEIKRVFTSAGVNPANPSASPVVPTEGAAPAAGPGAPSAPPAAFAPPAAPTPPAAAPAPAWAAGGAPAAAPQAAPAPATPAAAPPWAKS